MHGEGAGLKAGGAMSRQVVLEVGSLRSHAEGPTRRIRLSGRGLLAVKALALAALAAAALSGRLIPPGLPGSTVARCAGVEMRWPAGWRPGWTGWGVHVREAAARARGRRGREPCEALVMRLPFGQFEELHRLTTARVLADGWQSDEAAVLSAAAAFFHMDPRRQPLYVERVRVGDRPAVMAVSRRRSDWAALAVAPADDLVIAGLCAPTIRDLERVWRQWMAVLAAARLPEPVRSATVAAASNDE